MRRALIPLAGAALAACAGGSPADPSRPPPGDRVVIFEGTCDASGAVALDDRLFVVADDEDNVLRVYDAERGGPPLSVTDVSESLGLPIVGKKRPRPAEMDLEGATRDGDRAWWLASHGRDSGGGVRPERFKLFATTLPTAGAPLQLAGQAYDGLLADLVAEPALAHFDLAAAAELGPKQPGGVNIEGLTTTPDGHLLFGFRNPIPGGRALLVPVLNAGELIAGEARARFGPPVQVDLGGQGVRSLSWWRGRYLIVAGDIADGSVSRLYTWTGDDQPPSAVDVALDRYNPEGFFSPDTRDEILLLSDDGSVEIDGKPCKKLREPERKRFRGLWIAPPISGR